MSAPPLTARFGDLGVLRSSMSDATAAAVLGWSLARVGRERHALEVRARMSEARKRAWADPEVRARMSEARKRAWAKTVVRLARLPLWRRTVDRARELMDEGLGLEVAADALVQESRMAAP